MAELTANGLTIRRQTDVVDSLLESYKEDVHPDITIRDDELFGQQTNVVALKIAELEEALEAVNNSQDPLKAEGTNLDDIGSLALIPRQAATKSFTSTQYFTEKNGFVIPFPAILENPNTLDRFETTAEIEVTTNSCVVVEYSVNEVLNSTLYQVNINNTAFTFTTDSNTTALEIITGLKASIDATTPTEYAATLDTINEYLVITAIDNKVMAVSSEAYLDTEGVTVLGYVEAQSTGAINAPSNSITKMITSATVVTINPIQYTLGRAKESDEDYRNRILTTQASSGKATVEAIQDDTSLVSGVSTAKVIENDTDTTDAGGRPEHSFETVVQGGIDDDVAQAVMIAKPAGIQSFGNTPIVTQDKYGNDRTINITRPTTINLAFEVDYTTHTEVTFPVNGEDLIKTALADAINALIIGQDVIPFNFFGQIITAVGALEGLVIRVQQITNQGDPPIPANWQTTKLSINETSFASTITTDIVVAEV